MKSLLSVLILTLFTSVSYSQDKLLKAMTDESCDCISDALDDELSTQELEMALGLCLVKVSQDRKPQIKKQLGIDLDNFNNYEKFGEKLGEELAMNCPKFLDFIIQSMDEEGSIVNESLKEEGIYYGDTTMEGRVVDVDTNFPMKITVDNGSETHVIYCIGEFSGLEVLSDSKKLNKNNVLVSYELSKLYQPKNSEFMSIKELTSIEFK